MAKQIDIEEEINIRKEYDKLKNKLIIDETNKINKKIIEDIVESDNSGKDIQDIRNKYIRLNVVKDADWRTPTVWELDRSIKQIMKKDAVGCIATDKRRYKLDAYLPLLRSKMFDFNDFL